MVFDVAINSVPDARRQSILDFRWFGFAHHRFWISDFFEVIAEIKKEKVVVAAR